ncbi:LacI family DNA-binding transcriptional regulator [Streptomyces sp. CB02414]|uniref:LacI family DNA-binding transcriptional regulator n=2 Tax=unclassified Streptomyces TaxID=2593676 RepID=UPI0023780348|nr:LacI family DNA-binding transcriptional regulator [Streptomyces sp. CB02414]
MDREGGSPPPLGARSDEWEDHPRISCGWPTRRSTPGGCVPRRPDAGRAPSRGGARRATSVDVARLAGVSRTTVSDVLNDQRVERYHPETVERVRSAAAELGYVRSAAGRALVMGRSDFVVVVVPHVTYMRFQDIIEAFTGHIEDLGFSTVVHFKGPKDAENAGRSRLLNLVDALRPVGVVDLGGLTDREAAAVERIGCPLIAQEKPVDVNAWIGSLQAEHLHSRGFTELAYAFLSDARDEPYGRARSASVADYCAAEGLGAPTHLHVPIEPQGAREALAGLVEQRGCPVGVACHNDEVAIAVVFAAQRLGLRVPDDVAVIGVEGGDLGQVVVPRLSTVMGDVAASVQHVRHSLARVCGGSVPPGDLPRLADVFRVLPGETT